MPHYGIILQVYAVRNKNSREVLQEMLSILKAGLAENDQVLGNAVQQFKSEELAMDEQPMLQLMGFNTTVDHDSCSEGYEFEQDDFDDA